MTPRIPLGRAWQTARALMDAVCDRVTHVTMVGSLRRFDATVGDIALLAVSSSLSALCDELAAIPGITILHRGGTTATVQFERNPLTLHTTRSDTVGAALLYHTGSRAHTRELMRRAGTRDLELSPLGIRALKRKETVATISEEQVYELLDLPFIAPELREGQGEVEAAVAGALPALVERRDIRGDLHMHSTWSDGRDDIEGMVRQALALGYEYIAITDHSQSSGAACGLTVERLQRQRREVEEIRRRFLTIEILHGAEVDILPDGQLDYPDSILAQLDVVLASLHDEAGHGRAQLTERYLRAIRHPLVNIITHPTNRLVGLRNGYELDFQRLFQAAVETGTILEIDGAPAHLDMDGMLARCAIEAGVMVSIDSDCHRAELLDRHMTFGVGTARRGWVQARNVVNARPLPELRAILERKRQST